MFRIVGSCVDSQNAWRNGTGQICMNGIKSKFGHVLEQSEYKIPGPYSLKLVGQPIYDVFLCNAPRGVKPFSIR